MTCAHTATSTLCAVLPQPIEWYVRYYMFNQYLPMAVIMMMASSAFLFELNAYEKRVTLLFTAILTLMAFSVYLGESLPKTAYVTNMHCVVYLCYFMLVSTPSSFWMICTVISVEKPIHVSLHLHLSVQHIQ